MLEAEARARAARPEKLVLRVDRTDPSKNIVRGFRAFELYLDAHPEMHGRVGMLALLDPSRQDIPEYAEYLGAIQREARARQRALPGRRLAADRLQVADDFPQSVAAYKQFDVLLVNAIFDGLNLVAKEAPLVNERDGVLVLSENAGAHEELGDWALSSTRSTSPARPRRSTARSTMSRGRAARARRGDPRAWVREHDLAAWIERAARDSRPRSARPHALASRAMSELSHVDDSGEVRMVDVGGKPLSRRRAVARGARAHGGGDRAAAARAAEGRRARDRAARGDHGREADRASSSRSAIRCR